MTTEPIANPIPTYPNTPESARPSDSGLVVGEVPYTTTVNPETSAVGVGPLPAAYPGEMGPTWGPSDELAGVPGVSYDAGNDDKIAGSVAQAVADADARNAELQTDLYGQGSTIGDLMDSPPVPSDTGKMTGGNYPY